MRLITYSILLSILTCACTKDDNEKKDEENKTESEGFVVTSLPQNQDSPIENPGKVGNPVTFQLLLNSQNLTYKFHETATLLPIDADGQWVNTDRDVQITIQSENLQAFLEPSRSIATQFVIPKGSPSFQLSLRSDKVAESSMTVSTSDPFLSLQATFQTLIATPTKATATTPALNTCTLFEISFTDNEGRAAFFSTDKITELNISAAGCSVYSDASCSTSIATLQVQPDKSTVTDIWVNSGSASGFIDLVGGGFSNRVSCAGL